MVLLRIRINPIFLCNLKEAKSSDLLYDCRLILPNERMQKRGTERAWRATAIHVSDFIVAALNDQMQWAGTHYRKRPIIHRPRKTAGHPRRMSGRNT